MAVFKNIVGLVLKEAKSERQARKTALAAAGTRRQDCDGVAERPASAVFRAHSLLDADPSAKSPAKGARVRYVRHTVERFASRGGPYKASKASRSGSIVERAPMMRTHS